eukprot:TRINITY_DN10473_c0_g1_i1.p1 TRINITY_DN10473_c0_g1~~TRINITY_DN10473_c0_g1_i1.p1  ORF type:complete len:811 (-),score=191.91 TRINITY_DN10473_c0_g1_i1:1186-3393(-)
MDEDIDSEQNCQQEIKLQPRLFEGKDYMLVPKECWERLQRWYGGGPAIERKVISVGINKRLCVEIYPLELSIFYSKRDTPDCAVTLSKKSTVKELLAKISEKLKTSLKPDIQIYDYFHKMKAKNLTALESQTLDELGIENGQEILLEQKKEGEDVGAASKALTTTGNALGTPGLVGLHNLGNTCFMNSTLQCLSNALPLREYFLSDSYLKDINTKNPLGSKGVIAESFANLMKQMWSGASSTLAPRDLKRNVGQIAPQFAGFSQHDSQEFLGFLLDMVHEDLNRVKDKPSTEATEGNGQNDEETARKAWENHLKRNSSIIVDLFQGQFKSTIVCPDCKRVSVTFDPFMYTSLPLPVSNSTRFEINVMSEGAVPTKYAVTLEKGRDVAQIRAALAEISGIQPSNLVFAEIAQHKFHKFLDDTAKVSDNMVGELYCFVLPEQAGGCLLEHVTVPVIQRVMRPTTAKNRKQTYETTSALSFPLLLRLKRRMTKEALLRAVWDTLRHCVSTPEKISFEDISKVLNVRLASSPNQLIDIDHEDEDAPVCIRDGQQLIAEWDLRAFKKMYINDRAVKHHSSFMQRDVTNKVSLYRCIDLFSVEERLNEQNTWYCNVCKDHKRATKAIEWYKVPKILIIHLKRFSFANRLWRDKLDNFVDFPIKDLDISEFVKSKQPGVSLKYDLFAVSNHFGALGGGHYTAIAKNSKTGKWYEYDDSHCSDVKEDEAKSKAAYVLFYVQQS